MRPANKGKESEKNIWGGGFLGGSVWWLTCNLGDPGLIPASRRSPEEENGNLLQYSRLENPMDRGAWQVKAHGVTDLDMTEVTHTQHNTM